LYGYTHHMVDMTADGAAQTSGSAVEVPAAVRDGQPVVDVTRGAIRTAGPPDRTIALTFDDGPDPVWTPQILDVLRKHGVHATFFVQGSRAAEHPELVRRIRAEGHEIGVHTFTHVDLATVPQWRARLELSLTQVTVAGAADVVAPLVRLPYSSTNADLDDDAWRAIQQAGRQGYVTVLSTLDSDDLLRPGVAQIVAQSTPPDDAGQILLMHDGGGDRSQTVAALRQLLPTFQGQGIGVDTVSGAVGLTTNTSSASTADHWQGRALLVSLRVSDLAIGMLGWLLLIAGALTVVRAAIVLVAARRHHRRRRRKRWGPPVTTPVSIIVPAFNEQAGIEATVRSLLASDHPAEVVVVDDGSTDRTADIVGQLAIPGLVLIRQANAGKPAALNAGIAVASHELVVMVDGDTVLEPDAVRRLVQPFADQRVGAVSGNAKVANRRGFLGRWQHIEYVVGFNLDRRFFDLAECMPTVPGAIGAFRRTALDGIGRVSASTLAEDTDLTMALCRDGWRVVYEPRAVAWTETPATLRALWRQRYRWCYGTLQAMWKHRRAAVQSGPAGRLGRRGIGYLLLFQVLLPLLAPLVDVLAVYGLVFHDQWRVAGLWLGFLLVQALLSLYAFRLDGERLRPLVALPFQQVVYRQLMYLVVIQSIVTALAGARLRWHRMERYGTLSPPQRSDPRLSEPISG